MLLHEKLTDRIIGHFYDVYNELGTGFYESVYRNALLVAFGQDGIGATYEDKVRVYFRGEIVGDFKMDLLVENKIILELKVQKQIDASAEAQLINYLRATDIEVGLVLNFGPKPEFIRRVYENSRKGPQPPEPGN